MNMSSEEDAMVLDLPNNKKVPTLLFAGRRGVGQKRRIERFQGKEKTKGGHHNVGIRPSRFTRAGRA